MNTVVFGTQRENRIRAFIARYPYVGTSILQRIFFPFPSGQRKARQVLRRLESKKLVKRFKHGEYIYHIEPKTRQWAHTKAVTDFHFELMFSLERPDDILYYKREFEYGYGRADALYIVRVGNGGIKFFLEMDDEGNEFDKIPKYEEYFKSGLWRGEFFLEPLKNGRGWFSGVLGGTGGEKPAWQAGIFETRPKGGKSLGAALGGGGKSCRGKGGMRGTLGGG